MRRTPSANAAAQRRRRARMAEAERQAEAERNAAQHRARREREAIRQNEAERERAREHHAEQQRMTRAAQQEQQRQAEREANAERQRQQRADQEEEQRLAEREALAERMRQHRADQQEQQRQEEREANAELMRQQRAAQEEQQRLAEREALAERMRQHRAAQEEQQRQAEREANARRDQQRRAVARRQLPSLAALRPALVLSGAQVVVADDVGAMDRPCAYCGALRWQEECASLCCASGRVRLEPVPAPPPQLRHLWTADSVEARTFRQYSRHLNSALALSSLSAREVPPPAGTGGYAPCVVIQGRVYHRLGPLEARPDQVPTFGQIYVNDPLAEDPDAEAAIRLGHVRLPAATSDAVQVRLLDLLQRLQAELRLHNRWVRAFLMAGEILAEDVQHRTLVISAAARPAGEHERRYNAAEGLREVAVLMGDEPAQHDLVLRRRHVRGVAALQHIDETHRACDPLHFVLLFPMGTTGWHLEIPQAQQPGQRPRCVSVLQFYAHRLQVRPTQDDSLLRGCRLLQEFACMAYAKVEAMRLRYIVTHQRELRADLYQHVRDAVAVDAELGQPQQRGAGGEAGDQPQQQGAGGEEGGQPAVGRRVVLPATFIGGPRHMRER